MNPAKLNICLPDNFNSFLFIVQPIALFNLAPISIASIHAGFPILAARMSEHFAPDEDAIG